MLDSSFESLQSAKVMADAPESSNTTGPVGDHDGAATGDTAFQDPETKQSLMSLILGLLTNVGLDQADGAVKESKLSTALKKVIREVLGNSEFRDEVERAVNLLVNFTLEKLKSALTRIWKSMFTEDGFKWNYLYVLLAFGVVLVGALMKKNAPQMGLQLIEFIAGLIRDYIVSFWKTGFKKLGGWVSQNGFLVMFRGRSTLSN